MYSLFYRTVCVHIGIELLYANGYEATVMYCVCLISKCVKTFLLKY